MIIKIMQSIDRVEEYLKDSPNIKCKEVRKTISNDMLKDIDLIRKYTLFCQEKCDDLVLNLDNPKEKLIFDIISLSRGVLYES